MAVLRLILFLLKLLGIIILVIIGLLLLALFLVLFVPVRYKARFRRQEEPEMGVFADGVISWLFPVFRVRILFREKKLCYTVRIFGIPLFTSGKPKRVKGKQKAAEKKGTPEKQKKAPEPKEMSKAQETSVLQETGKEREAPNLQEVNVPESKKSTVDSTKEAVGANVATEKRKGLSGRIKRWIEKLAVVPGLVKAKVLRLLEKLKLLWKKKEAVIAFFSDERHKMAIGTTLGTGKKLISHLFPQKIRGTLLFGTGDPESTGKALAVFGILYGAYGKQFLIVPDFNEKKLAVDVNVRGRIRFATLLLYGIRCWRNKQVRRLYKDLKQLLQCLGEKTK